MDEVGANEQKGDKNRDTRLRRHICGNEDGRIHGKIKRDRCREGGETR